MCPREEREREREKDASLKTHVFIPVLFLSLSFSCRSFSAKPLSRPLERTTRSFSRVGPLEIILLTRAFSTPVEPTRTRVLYKMHSLIIVRNHRACTCLAIGGGLLFHLLKSPSLSTQAGNGVKRGGELRKGGTQHGCLPDSLLR